jgi:MFS family permease
LTKRISFSILRHKNFRLLLGVRIFTAVAIQSQAVIIGWQAYSLTKSLFILGTIGLIEAIPAISCAFFSGHIVDKSNPRTVLAACLGAMSLNTILLCFLAGGAFFRSQEYTIIWLFAGVFVSGVARSFFVPSSYALLSQIVPRSELSQTSAWQASGFHIAAISGPAAAGLVYGGYGAAGAWLLPSLAITMAFVMTQAIALAPSTETRSKREPFAASIRTGWKFITTDSVLMPMMCLDMFAVLLGGATAMLPAYADRILHVGSEGLGILRAAPAMGAIFISLLLAIRPLKKLSAQHLLYVVSGFGFCIIGFGLSKNFLLSIIFLAVSGIFDSIGMIIRGSIMQISVPQNMQGRVSSISSMFYVSANEIGAFESGTAALLLGLMPSVVAGGIGTLVIVAIIALTSPKFRSVVVEV